VESVIGQNALTIAASTASSSTDALDGPTYTVRFSGAQIMHTSGNVIRGQETMGAYDRHNVASGIPDAEVESSGGDLFLIVQKSDVRISPSKPGYNIP
jgi:hypothetical protein